MPNLAAQDSLVLVLSHEMLEAADIADFATQRSLGRIVIERSAQRARVMSLENRFDIAFIGLPKSEERSTLINALSARRTHVILVGADPRCVTDKDIRVLSRPFTETDLENAIYRPIA